MAEYIDKELAIEGMWAGLNGGTICGPEDTETFLRSLPAADVEPVRHGRWIFGDTCGHSWMKCSECLVSQSGQTLCFTYCPNCGAKMDGEA